MTFIDTIIDKTNTDIVVSDTKGDQEARDDPRVGLGSVQKREHAVAGIVGSDNKPPTSAPRDILPRETAKGSVLVSLNLRSSTQSLYLSHFDVG